jgi:hypothetical protein
MSRLTRLLNRRFTAQIHGWVRFLAMTNLHGEALRKGPRVVSSLVAFVVIVAVW